MKARLERRDLERLPMEARLIIDAALEQGADLSVVSKRMCRTALLAAPIRPYRIVGIGTPCDSRTDRIRRSNDKPNCWHRLDQWDLVQAFAPVHQPRVRSVDMASMSAMFKEFYSVANVQTMMDRPSPFLGLPPFTPSLDR